MTKLLIILSLILCTCTIGCALYKTSPVPYNAHKLDPSTCSVLSTGTVKYEQRQFLKHIHKLSWSSIDGGVYHTLKEVKDSGSSNIIINDFVRDNVNNININELCKRVISRLLKEYDIVAPYGRNWQTIDNEPFSYRDFPGIDVEEFGDPSGGYWVKITCEKDPSLTTPMRLFKGKEDADHFIRREVEKMKVSLMNNQETPVDTVSAAEIE